MPPPEICQNHGEVGQLSGAQLPYLDETFGHKVSEARVAPIEATKTEQNLVHRIHIENVKYQMSQETLFHWPGLDLLH